MTDQAYRSYLIKLNPLNHKWEVSKDGFHIIWTDSLDAAKAEIDALLD